MSDVASALRLMAVRLHGKAGGQQIVSLGIAGKDQAVLLGAP